MSKGFRAVPLENVNLKDVFLASRIDTNRRVTLDREYELLKSTGRLDAFDYSKEASHNFWDSDNAKWVEAAAYSLAKYPDPELEAKVDAYIDVMEKAQEEDGYLNSHFHRRERSERWSDLWRAHELYCAGHLMEAAVAYYEHCGKRKMLDIMCRYTDYIRKTFGTGPGQRRGCPGHSEIELALVRMYRATGNKDYLDLSEYFTRERGTEPNCFEEEVFFTENPNKNDHMLKLDRFQAHKPLVEQDTAEGHAVRVGYLFAGLADLAAETGEKDVVEAAERLWKNITEKRMYITGGIGSQNFEERFTVDYDLPNESAYAETCAAISLIFFAKRMLDCKLDRRYSDVIETALYNCVLAGVSLSGTHFFYANRLAVYPELHDSHICDQKFTSFRQEWFGCACCPPNVARILSSLEGYVASTLDNELAVHLYASGDINAELSSGKVALGVETRYPWDGEIGITVNPEKAGEFTLSLRLPGWCREPKLKVNGEAVDLCGITEKGYAKINREWKAGDKIELSLPMPVERMEAHPSVRQDCGKVALQRGPLVYCLEECDNGKDLADIGLPAASELTAEWDESFPGGGAMIVTSPAVRRSREGWEGTLYRSQASSEEQITLKAVPYCLWDNREEGEMRIWLNQK